MNQEEIEQLESLLAKLKGANSESTQEPESTPIPEHIKDKYRNLLSKKG